MTYFDRVPMWFRPCVETALGLIPITVTRLIEPRILCCISPRFVGLHYQDMAVNFPTVAAGGNTYDNCAHACFAEATPDEQPTIAFPDPSRYPDPVATLLHEYGHLFDEATGFYLNPPTTTAYSESNRYEAVAEAFELILRPPSGRWEAEVQGEAFRPLRVAMGVSA